MMKQIQLKLLRRRNDIGIDLFGEKRRIRDSLLKNRFEGYSRNARMVMEYLACQTEEGLSLCLNSNPDSSSIWEEYENWMTEFRNKVIKSRYVKAEIGGGN